MFSKFFILRPIFATVISAIIVIAGLVSTAFLPVSQYPTITPVQIQVTTTYPGADALTVGTSVTAPIEAQINGVDNMLYMTSTSSSTGQMTITVYFTLETDPDIAQVLVQNRVNLALPELPNAVKQYGISVQKQSNSTLMILALFNKDGRYSQDYVTTYTNVYVLDAIKRVNGAGQAQIFGVPDQAMRIWMNPDRMASLQITTSDIQRSISSQNALFGAGQLGQKPSTPHVQMTLPVLTERPFVEPDEYENIILRASQDGSAIVRVKDVATAEVGRKQYLGDNTLNGAPACFIVVYQQPGANGLQVSTAVRELMEEMKQTLPDGIEYIIALDTTDFVRLSIKEVIITLLEAILLVIVVVYVFLQNFRATIICTAAVFVALIGTFSGMLALGFSINLLTLFGMVLAIGMVVDDAIVVVENVERNLTHGGLSPAQAAIKAMQEVSGPVVAVVLVLSAVFIPAAFLPGTTGQLYKQFAITIVISVTISGFVALTLTPAMCAVILKESKPITKGFFFHFNNGFAKATSAYGKSVRVIIAHRLIAFICFVAMLGVTVYLFRTVPTSFIPGEDQGYVLAQLIMPNGASMTRTENAARKIDEIFSTEKSVLNRTVVNGYSLIDSQYLTNTTTFFITLKDFEERYKNAETAKEENSRALLRSIMMKTATFDSGIVIPISPPAIPGIGTTGGFEFWIQDKGSGEPQELFDVTKAFIQEASKRPELVGLSTTFRSSTPQLKANVDRAKAVLLQVPVEDVYNALQAQFGSLQVSQYEQYSRTWDVILQSEAQYREKPSDIGKLYTRSNKGAMVPLAALISTEYTIGPDLIPHFNGFPAAQITGNAAAGYSSGDAIHAMESVAKESLPQGYGFAWSGMALQEKSSGSSSTAAFVFGILIVFLILAAQYESWSLPCSVMTAVPFGIVGALIATVLRGLENDVYFQIGLLVLVGLAAKNAILIVEFAVDLKKKGKDALESAVEAGELRLRPIIMTSLAFILGVLPLFLAKGAGANARHSIGTGIMGGMIGASTLALLFVPLFFWVLETLRGDAGPLEEEADQEKKDE